MFGYDSRDGEFDIDFTKNNQQKKIKVGGNKFDITYFNPLYLAVAQGQTQQVKSLLEGDPNLIDSEFQGNKRLLHFAAANNHEEIMRVLLEAKPELIDVVINHCGTALHEAAYYGNLKIVQMLFKIKPELSEITNFHFHNNAFHVAVSQGHINVAQYLLLERANLIDSLADFNKTALHLAARHGDMEMVQFLLSKKPELIESFDKWKDNALHLVATNLFSSLEKNCAEVAELLLNTKPEIAYASNDENKSALECAIETKQFITVEIFIHFAPFDNILDTFIKEGGKYLVQAKDLADQYRALFLPLLPKPLVKIISEYAIDPSIKDYAPLLKLLLGSEHSVNIEHTPVTEIAASELLSPDDQPVVVHLGQSSEQE